MMIIRDAVISQIRKNADESDPASVDLLLSSLINSGLLNKDDLLMLGQDFAVRDRIDIALLIFVYISKKYPGDTCALFNVGLAHTIMGSYSEAKMAYEEALRINPKDVFVLINLGELYSKTNNFDDALACFNNAIEIRPEIAESHNNKGILLNKLGNYCESICAFDEAVRLCPNFYEALSNKSEPLIALKKYNEGLEACDDALRINPKYINAILKKACIFQDLLRFNESIELLDQAIAINPRESEIWLRKAYAYRGLGNYQLALEQLDIALNLDLNNADAHALKGLIFFNLGYYTDSIIHFDKTIAINPNDPVGWIGKGDALNQLKCFEDAILHYDKALEIEPNTASAFYAKSLSNIALSEFQEAINNLEEAINLGYRPASHAEFILSALKPGELPMEMPTDFVSKLFDDYAIKFNDHLIKTLNYKAPKVIYEMIRPNLMPNSFVLDLGCGTGLVGEKVMGHTKKIIGVDLSQAMLDRAKLTGAYSLLLKDDIKRYLMNCREKFDFILAVDVFIYIGDLEEIFGLISPALNNNGIFCFCVELLEGESYSLSPKRLRYAHSLSYIRKLSDINNLEVINVIEDMIREENNACVNGLYCLLSNRN